MEPDEDVSDVDGKTQTVEDPPVLSYQTNMWFQIKTLLTSILLLMALCFGANAKQAQHETWIDIGAIVVEVGPGVVAAIRGGEFLGKLDFSKPLAKTQTPSVNYTSPGGAATKRTGSAVDGIYGNTRPMADEFPELAGVNPHYVDGAGPGVNTNCVLCVNATVDRLTGRNPDAVAGPLSGYGTPNDLLPSVPFGFRSPTNPANVTNELVAQGDGAVAVVRIQQAGPVEHVIVGVNRGGTVHYIDPQLGSIVDLQSNLTVIPGYR